MTSAELHARYRRKLLRSAKLVQRIAKMTFDEDEVGRWFIPHDESVNALNELIMDARNIVDGQEG